jgi:PAS domain S-box-containing protein
MDPVAPAPFAGEPDAFARAAEHARMLSEASKAFAESGLRLDALLVEVVRTVASCLGDTCMIRILTPDGRMLVCPAFYARDPEETILLKESVLVPQSSLVGESADVLRTGRARLVPSVDPAILTRTYPQPEVIAYLERFAPRAMMIAPLRTRGRAFGTISVWSSAPNAAYSGEDLAFLGELADRAALAIENADLFRRLAESEDKLNMAMEAGRLGVFEWDVATGTVFWSSSLEEAHGIPKGSFEGTFEAFQRDVHPDDREQVLTAIHTVVRERTHHHLEYRIIRPDGEVRWLEANAQLHCDPEGHPVRLLGICVDVTERKRAERHLERTLESLTHADRRKDEFLAMLAHELRNPLTPMVLALNLLESRDAANELERRAHKILGRQLHHMTRLVDDLLDVSRISRGKIELAREVLDLCRIVREVVLDHGDAAQARNLRFEVELPNEPCWVSGDGVRLAQVLGNVVGNALKFSDAGGAVRVALERDPDNGWPTLSVRDQGVGIAGDLLPSIFDAFTQADQRHGGLGLGLAVVRGIVELHGGHVTAVSDGVGTGTELRISLPPSPDATAAVTTEVAPTASRPFRILVVEDNADAAELLCDLLRSKGHCVEAADSGTDAAQIAVRFHPDVVLCDLGLPGKDGYEVAAELRRTRETAQVHLIALSGYGSKEDKRRSRQAGFDLHVTKPVNAGALLALLGELERADRAEPPNTR